MGEKSRSVIRRERWTRILALAAFFNFSGLNNGFSFFAVSSGQVQRFDFTPRLLQSAASLVNPLNWKEKLLAAFKTRVSRSKKAVVFASRNAVKNLLAESALIQTWMADSLAKNLSGSPESPKFSSKELKSGESRSRPILSSGVEFQAFSASSYVRTEGASSWFLERHRLWNNRKDAGKYSQGPPGLSLQAQVPSASFLHLGNRAGVSLGFMPENLKLWLSSCLSRAGGGSPAPFILAARGLRITLHLSTQGDFLLGAAI